MSARAHLLAAALVLAWPQSALAEAPDAFAAALADAAAGRHGAAAATFRQLALTGDAEAAHNLAVLFRTGRGVPQNLTEAAFWAWQARLLGIVPAQALIDEIMPQLPDDRRLALSARLEAEWRPPAEDGDGAAMLALAAILLHARPEPAIEDAHAWQSIAAALDVPGAVAAREASLGLLEPAERLDMQDVALERFIAWCADRNENPPAACSAAGG